MSNKKLLEPIKDQPKHLPYQVMKEVVIKSKCKTCGKNDRRTGSAYCGACATKFHSGL